MTTSGLGFNRWMQHTKHCVSGRGAANGTETSDLLPRKPEGIDVGALAKRRISATDRPTV